jgi:hypothetical protein
VRAARWSFWAKAFARFRYGDGFSHSRALALQLSPAFIPLVIAAVGLSGTVATDRIGQVLRLTLIALSPGGSDEVVRVTLAEQREGGQIALWLGLAFAIATLTTAMGQVERGANRIYGIQRDRPSLRKYRRALAMAFGAGLPAMGGFGVLLAGSSYGDAVEQVYGVSDDVATVVAFPVGTVLLLTSITAMLRYSPRRRQPGWSGLGWERRPHSRCGSPSRSARGLRPTVGFLRRRLRPADRGHRASLVGAADVDSDLPRPRCDRRTGGPASRAAGQRPRGGPGVIRSGGRPTTSNVAEARLMPAASSSVRMSRDIWSLTSRTP